MTVYDRLVLPYAEQKAKGLKPRGICSACGREKALLADDTIRAHNAPSYGRSSGRTTTDEVCPGGGERTANLSTVRIAAPLTEPEARLVREAVQKVLAEPLLAAMYDQDGIALLTSALAKLKDPVNTKEQ